jgi:hypothetical protein
LLENHAEKKADEQMLIILIENNIFEYCRETGIKGIFSWQAL